MKRAIGMQAGQKGDLIMTTVAARAFKERYPDWTLTLGMGPQYADMAPLFAQHPYFDDVHVYNSYDNWPNDRDKDYLTRANYDVILNAKPNIRHDWFRYGHQAIEMARVYGLEPTSAETVLTKWFDIPKGFENTIALAAFAGYYSPNNDKRLSVEQAQTIVNNLCMLGYNVLQLGGMDEPALRGAIRLDTNYFDSVRNMLACKALIHTDTGMGHVAGAYNHPSMGIYGARYHGLEFVKNIQPVHSRFRAVVAETMDQIDLDKVVQELQTLLA